MNLEYEIKARRVVPNWRYYENTLAAGELNMWKFSRNDVESYSIDDYIGLWNEHHSVFRAGDLMSAAITNGMEDENTVKDAAKYILDREDTSSFSLVSSARKILGVEANRSQSKIEIDRLRECTATEDIRLFIHNVKLRLQLMPYNPYLYVDLARAYLLIGQTQKAENAILQAIHYGASDRFVARSAARFFLHMQDKDRALHAIRANGAVSVDPWLMAAEISINLLRDKSSNYIKKGKSLIDSGNCRPFAFTELASSIGTVELVDGSNRKSNKLFRKALIEPNDNSLAQVKWVNSFNPLPINIEANVLNDYEVKTFDALYKRDYHAAVHEAVSWICDMPFASKPVNIGYKICVDYLHDYSLASAILDVGLQSDETSPFYLNNKAYCSARAGNMNDAKAAFGKLIESGRIDDSMNWSVCIPATEGIILYRDNKLTEGRTKYEEAISIAKQLSGTQIGRTLYNKALLNFCRERIHAHDGDIDNILEEANAIEIGEMDNELKLLLEEVRTEYKTLKK